MLERLSLAQNMERAFGQYVSGQVLDRIRQQHGEAGLPAELREATVFFADIRGFTSMSEKLEPAVVLGILNRYFERVIAVIDARWSSCSTVPSINPITQSGARGVRSRCKRR